MIRCAGRFLFALLMALLLSGSLAAQHTIIVRRGRTDGGSGIFPTPPHLRIDAFGADGTWTAPAGVTSALVELWAPGGTGLANTGAGGGGEYCRKLVTVVPTTGYAVVVGNSAGENSTFASTEVVAVAGAGGASGGAGGTGGTGSTCFAGGAGAVGTGDQGGGGGGGTEGAGGNASGNIGGSGGLYFGGIGSNPATLQWAYGGGGRSQTGSASQGANGHARITYLLPAADGFPTITARYWGSSGNATSHAINLPVCASGNLLIVLFSIDAGPTLSGYTGWTALAEPAEGSVKLLALYKTSTGSDSLTITSSASEGSTHLSVCIAGATGTPDATGATGSSANLNPPEHTHAGGSTKALWIAGGAHDNAAQTNNGIDISAPPSGYADFLFLTGSVALAGGSPSGMVTIATLHAEAATQDPGTFTSSNDGWAAVTIAVPGS